MIETTIFAVGKPKHFGVGSTSSAHQACKSTLHRIMSRFLLGCRWRAHTWGNQTCSHSTCSIVWHDAHSACKVENRYHIFVCYSTPISQFMIPSAKAARARRWSHQLFTRTLCRATWASWDADGWWKSCWNKLQSIRIIPNSNSGRFQVWL